MTDYTPVMADTEFAIRMSVVGALKHLLATTDIDHILVGELCREAGISRTTFYRYFNDKYAITEWHFGYCCDQYSQGIGRRYTFHESTSRILDVFRRESLLYIGSCRSVKSSSMLLYAKRHFVENLESTIADYLGVELDESLRFQVEYAGHLIVDMTGWWINGHQEVPVDTFLDALDAALPPRLRFLLDGNVQGELGV